MPSRAARRRPDEGFRKLMYRAAGTASGHQPSTAGRRWLSSPRAGGGIRLPAAQRAVGPLPLRNPRGQGERCKARGRVSSEAGKA